MNSIDHSEMLNDDLHRIDWVPDSDIKLRPGKSDAENDVSILDVLEKQLRIHAANNYRPLTNDPIIPPYSPVMNGGAA